MSKEAIKFPSLLSKHLVRKEQSFEYKICSHKKLLLDQKIRMMECSECQKLMDPFDFLWGVACERESFEYRIDELQKQIKFRCERITELKKEEQRIKQRLKRAAAEPKDMKG